MDLVLNFTEFSGCVLPFGDRFRIFFSSLLNCRFILRFLCIYLIRSHFIPFLLHGDFNLFLLLATLHSPLFLFSFISLKFFFFSSFSATLQTEFFANIITGLETIVRHNRLGYITVHNCNL